VLHGGRQGFRKSAANDDNVVVDVKVHGVGKNDA